MCSHQEAKLGPVLTGTMAGHLCTKGVLASPEHMMGWREGALGWRSCLCCWWGWKWRRTWAGAEFALMVLEAHWRCGLSCEKWSPCLAGRHWEGSSTLLLGQYVTAGWNPYPLHLQETLVVQEILGPVQCAWSEMSFFGLMVSVQEGYSSGSSARAALLSPPESVLKKHLYHIRWQGIRLVIILSLPSFQVKLIANEVFTNRRWEHHLQLHLSSTERSFRAEQIMFVAYLFPGNAWRCFCMCNSACSPEIHLGR